MSLLIHNKSYLSSGEAAAKTGYTPDYVGILARRGSIEAESVGGKWYVEEASLDAYYARSLILKEKRAQELSELRRGEYAHAVQAHYTTFVPIQPATPVPVPLSKFVFFAFVSAAAFLFAYAGLPHNDGIDGLIAKLERGEARAAHFASAFLSELFDETAPSSGISQHELAQENLAAAAESGGENFFLYLVNGFVSFVDRTIAALFGNSEEGFSKNTIPEKPVVVSTQPSADVQPVVVPVPPPLQNQPSIVERVVQPQNIVQNITRNVILSGVSESTLASALVDIENKFNNQFARVNQVVGNPIPYSPPPSSGGIANTIALLNKIDKLDGVDITGGTITGATISGGSISMASLSGILSIENGGTGTSTLPTYGQLLLGNSLGGYDLVATSSLGITGGGGLSSYDAWLHSPTYGATASATTSPVWFQSGLYASSTIAFGTAAKDFYFDSATGRLGISSTTPWAQLSINPDALGSGVPEFVVGSSSATHLIVTGAGNVGIGTAAPAPIGAGRKVLQILDGTGTGSELRLDSTTVTSRWYNNNTESGIGSQSSHPFKFLVGGSAVGTFDTNGNFGIGTTSPYAKLSVVGQAVAEYFTATSTSATSTFPWLTTSSFALSTASAGCAQFGAGGQLTSTGSGCGSSSGLTSYDAWTHTLNGMSATTSAIGIGTTTPFSQLSVSTSTASSPLTKLFTVASSTGAELLSVLGGGNVGIGTTSPWGLLSVNPNALGAGVPAFVVGSSTATNFIVTNAGNVGIGSTTPYAKLSVETATSQDGIYLKGSSSGGNAVLRLYNDSGTYNQMFTARSASSDAGKFFLQVNNAATNAFVADTSGNIGIGSTTPWAKLAVNPVAGDANQFVVGSSTATSFIINNAGNVGIGTTSPSSLFNVYSNSTLFAPTFEDANASGRTILTAAMTGGAGAASLQLRAHGSSYSETLLGSSMTNAVTLLGSPQSGAVMAVGTFTNSPLTFATNNSERLRIDTSGNVGIGTTTPQWLLNPYSASASQLALSNGAGIAQWAFRNAGGNLYFATTTTDGTATTSTSALTILGSSGNVGIGTSNPSSSLHVAGNLANSPTVAGVHLGLFPGAEAGLQTFATAGSAFDFSSASGRDYDFRQYFSPGSNTYSFSASTTANMLVLNGNGNVGIGTTSPAAKLTVSGSTVDANGIRSIISTGNNRRVQLGYDTGDFGSLFAYDDTAGVMKNLVLQNPAYGSANVGIGTTTPQYALTPYSATAPQLALSYGAGFSQWGFRNVNGNLYIATTTTAGTATSSVAALQINTNGTLIVGGGTGKITIGTFDPVYTVGGTAYATYAAGMIGLKEEVTGTADITTATTAANGTAGYTHVISFDEEPEGSDLWLFAQTTHLRKNIDKLVVLLSSEGGSKVWYSVDRATRKVYLLSDTPTRVSYRMTAPRFDAHTWSNYNHDGVVGFLPPSDDTTDYFDASSFSFTFDGNLLSGTTTVTQLTAPAPPDAPSWAGALSSASIGFKNALAVLGEGLIEAYDGAQYFADGIFKRIFAGEVHTDKLCVSDDSGEVCITKAELQALLLNAGSQNGGGSSNGGGGDSNGGGSGSGSGSSGGGEDTPPPAPNPDEGNEGGDSGSGEETPPPSEEQPPSDEPPADSGEGGGEETPPPDSGSPDETP